VDGGATSDGGSSVDAGGDSESGSKDAGADGGEAGNSGEEGNTGKNGQTSDTNGEVSVLLPLPAGLASALDRLGVEEGKSQEPRDSRKEALALAASAREICRNFMTAFAKQSHDRKFRLAGQEDWDPSVVAVNEKYICVGDAVAVVVIKNSDKTVHWDLYNVEKLSSKRSGKNRQNKWKLLTTAAVASRVSLNDPTARLTCRKYARTKKPYSTSPATFAIDLREASMFKFAAKNIICRVTLTGVVTESVIAREQHLNHLVIESRDEVSLATVLKLHVTKHPGFSALSHQMILSAQSIVHSHPRDGTRVQRRDASAGGASVGQAFNRLSARPTRAEVDPERQRVASAFVSGDSLHPQRAPPRAARQPRSIVPTIGGGVF
jgi:hypothetical protein